MNIKRLLTLISFGILLVAELKAQFPTSDQNPIWTYSINTLDGDSHINTVSLGEDTLINDKIWNPLEIEGEFLGILPTLIRIDSSKVYFRRNHPYIPVTEEFLMYDFDLSVGDSITTHIYVPEGVRPVKYFLEKIDSFPYSYQPLRRMWMRTKDLTPPRDFMAFWNERIGLVENPFLAVDFCIYIACEVDIDFICLKTDKEVIYSNGPNSCVAVKNSIIYVNNNLSTGNNNGSSWTHAYHNLQTALQQATYGDEVWVAQGTYHPDSIDREISFVIPTGVKVYGGFQGTEAVLSERELDAYPTILSGNIGMPEDSTDNSYHVVVMENPDSNNLIDGFTLLGGYAAENGALTQTQGGGIHAIHEGNTSFSTPTIKNCLFSSNIARYGGAIFAQNKGVSSGFKIINCSFKRNVSTVSGGAVLLNGENLDSFSLVIENCVFEQNRAGNQGGAIYFSESSGDITISNCSFMNNYARLAGGAIGFSENVPNASCTFNLNNSIFSNNSTVGEGGAFRFANSDPITAKIDMDNCEFNDNRSINDTGGAIICLNTGGNITFTLSNSIFKNNFAAISGAGIRFLDENSAQSTIDINNSKFIDNQTSSSELSGGFYYDHGFEAAGNKNNTKIFNSLFTGNNGAFANRAIGGNTTTQIYNCTFFDNGEFPVIKTWSPLQETTERSNDLFIGNTILWEPQHETPRRILGNNSILPESILKSYFVQNCFFSTDTCISTAGTTTVSLCGNGNFFGEDIQFQNIEEANFHLRPCSPAINQGIIDDNFMELNTKNIDLNGVNRVLEGRPDMGAYENESLKFELEMVKLPDCSDSKNGAIQFHLSDSTDFTIQWEDQTIKNTYFDSLGAGTHTFLVLTASGCTDSITYTMEAPAPIEVDFSILPAQTATSNDGAVVVNSIGGGIPPYIFQLVRGDSLFAVSNVPPGNYEFHITDKFGCTYTEKVEISFSTKVVNLDLKNNIKIFPNPIKKGERLVIKTPIFKVQEGHWSIIDLFGRMLQSGEFQQVDSEQLEIDTNQLNPGAYFFKLADENFKIHTVKFVVH